MQSSCKTEAFQEPLYSYTYTILQILARFFRYFWLGSGSRKGTGGAKEGKKPEIIHFIVKN